MDYGVLSTNSLSKIQEDVNKQLENLKKVDKTPLPLLDENNADVKQKNAIELSNHIKNASQSLNLEFLVHVDSSGQITLSSKDKILNTQDNLTDYENFKDNSKKIVLKTSLSHKNIKDFI